MSLYEENNLESQFKFDCLSNAIIAQMGLSGNPFSCLLQPTLQFSWSVWSIPVFQYQTPKNE
jgi:hypothetical protein